MPIIADPLRRETTTMVLYVAVVLLATVAALPLGAPEDDLRLGAVLWGAAAGLAAAHWFAFHLAGAFYSGGRVSPEEVRAGISQVLAALAVALVATIPLPFLDDRDGAAAAVGILTGIIGTIGFMAARRAGSSWLAALGRALVMVILGGIVVVLKVVLTH